VARDLRAYGRVKRGWTGVVIAEPMANSDSWRRQAGVLVQYVAPASPAARAGVAAGDTITRVGSRPVRNFLDWEAALLDLGVGDTLRVAVRRADGGDVLAMRSADLPSERAQRVSLGDLELVSVTPAIQAERQLALSHGALVVNAGPETQQTVGLQPGDVIYRINNEDITDAEQVRKVIAYFRNRGGGLLYFERHGTYNYVPF